MDKLLTNVLVWQKGDLCIFIPSDHVNGICKPDVTSVCRPMEGIHLNNFSLAFLKTNKAISGFFFSVSSQGKATTERM